MRCRCTGGPYARVLLPFLLRVRLLGCVCVCVTTFGPFEVWIKCLFHYMGLARTTQ